jgi:hypothetical protein
LRIVAQSSRIGPECAVLPRTTRGMVDLRQPNESGARNR